MEKNREILVSIIIPVYQAKDTLRRCVLSCLNQQFMKEGELEAILVDDGSTDGSSDICDELARDDPQGRISVIHTENHGVSHARNIGIEKASGRFIVFVDSDDEVKKGYLENLMRYADEGTNLVDEGGSFTGTAKLSGFQYIENSVLNSNTHVWGKLFDRESIAEGEIRFKEGLAIGEDLLFLLDFAISQGKRHTIRCIDSGKYIYTENASGAMKQAFRESYMGEITAWKEAENKLIPYQNEMSGDAFVNLSVSQVLTAFLVIGKVAVLDADKRGSDLARRAVFESGEQIRHALKTRGVFGALPFGHKLKVMVFGMSPELYLRLYNRHKS